MRTSWVVLTGLTVVAGGCQRLDSELASTRQPIVAGTLDTADPAIMEVLSFKGNTGARCTATLVTPRVLVLAAHCFVETPGFQRFVFPGNDDRNVPDKDLLPAEASEPWFAHHGRAPRRGCRDRRKIEFGLLSHGDVLFRTCARGGSCRGAR